MSVRLPDLRHELAEFGQDSNVDWMIRCSCGWTCYYAKTAQEGVERLIAHITATAEDRYTQNDLEEEWFAGESHGYDSGFADGRDEGWELGREKLIEELKELKGE